EPMPAAFELTRGRLKFPGELCSASAGPPTPDVNGRVSIGRLTSDGDWCWYGTELIDLDVSGFTVRCIVAYDFLRMSVVCVLSM
ncbi:hypothetical protein EV175_006437, partial [Coemansia sp. RSA 1933]